MKKNMASPLIIKKYENPAPLQHVNQPVHQPGAGRAQSGMRDGCDVRVVDAATGRET